MSFLSFKNAYEARLGISTFGFVGEWSVANKRRNYGIKPPFVRSEHITCRAGIKKLFLHTDQIFWRGLSANPWKNFKYCEGYNSLEMQAPATEIFATAENNLIIIECANAARIKEIHHSGVEIGSIEVCLGMDLTNNMPQIALIDALSPSVVPNKYTKKTGLIGKVLTIQLFGGASLPYFEFITEEPVAAMPDKIIQGKNSKIQDIVSVRYECFPKSMDYQHLDKHVFDSPVQDLDIGKLVHKGLFRFNPMFDETMQWDVWFDEVLARYRADNQLQITVRLTGLSEKLKSNYDAIGLIASKVAARYGVSTNLTDDLCRIDTETEMDYGDFKRKNRVKKSKNLLSHIWVDDIEIPKTAEEFLLASRKIYNGCLYGDKTIIVPSIPFPADRNFIYTTFRLSMGSKKKMPWDVFVIQLNSIEELPDLYSCIILLNTYFTGFPIWVKVGFHVEPAQWPGYAHLFLHWNIDKLVFMNFNELFEEDRFNYVAKPEFFELADWYHKVKDKDITKLQFSDDAVRVIYRKPSTEARMDYLMLGPNPEGNILVQGTPLRYPVGQKIRAT